MNAARSLAGWTARFAALFVLSVACVIAGGAIVGGALPADAATEPGLVSPAAGLFALSLAHLIVAAALVLGSRWSGWKLALALGLAYYGAVTVLMQIETWYFLSAVTVDPELLPRLFLMGVPTAAILVPATVWMLGKGSAAPREPSATRGMPAMQWAWKLLLIALTYLVLYWGAGYFIAWQNPDLRAFYGRPGPPLPFLAHTADTLRHEPMLFPLQILRSQLWVLCALPVIRGSRLGSGWTALLVGLLFSLPQNVGLLMENPLIPSASVRLSHLVETASSTFLFRSTMHDPPFTIHTRLTASGGGFYRSGMGTLRLELPPHGAQTERNERRWRELLADPELARFEGRIETDRYGHIVVTPPPTPKHGSLQSEIAHLLRIRLSHGRVITECPVSTADGVKAADVAWASADAMRELGDRVSFPRAPEVCVEIVSPRNTEAEIREKAALFHDAGAQEVWVCSDAGVMTFLRAGEPAPMEASRIFRDFPVRIVLS